jgi:hypothetical protein
VEEEVEEEVVVEEEQKRRQRLWQVSQWDAACVVVQMQGPKENCPRAGDAMAWRLGLNASATSGMPNSSKLCPRPARKHETVLCVE